MLGEIQTPPLGSSKYTNSTKQIHFAALFSEPDETPPVANQHGTFKCRTITKLAPRPPHASLPPSRAALPPAPTACHFFCQWRFHIATSLRNSRGAYSNRARLPISGPFIAKAPLNYEVCHGDEVAECAPRSLQISQWGAAPFPKSQAPGLSPNEKTSVTNLHLLKPPMTHHTTPHFGKKVGECTARRAWEWHRPARRWQRRCAATRRCDRRTH